MAINQPTANLFLDTTYEHKDGKYPVKITIYYLGHKRRRGLPFSFTEDDWKKIHSKKLRNDKLKEAKIKLDYYVGEKFEAAIKKTIEPFSFERFFDNYFDKNTSQLENQNVYTLFEEYIKELQSNGQYGTSVNYRSSLNSLKRFRKKLTFSMVTVTLCKDYEHYMRKKGKSTAYTAIILRNLRTIYNLAIYKGIADKGKYPFSQNQNDGKYQIKSGLKAKKALTAEQLRALKAYEPKTPAQRKAYAFWWFSYYANGLNMKDICLLQYKDIVGETVTIERAKTVRTQRVKKPIQFFLSPELQAIINEFGNKDKTSDALVFNILKHGMTEKQIRDSVQSYNHTVNKRLEVISNDLGFEKPITTSAARHSFSTQLKRKGLPVGIVSESLGHSSEKTTQNYLDSFKIDTLKHVANVLNDI
jgi:integrase